MTKVLKNRYAIAMPLAVCLGSFAIRSRRRARRTGSALAHQSGPAEALYLQLSSAGLDPSRVFRVREASLDRPSIHITLEDGTIAFTRDVLGRITGAFFEGDGEVLLVPPNEVERKSMSLFTGMAILEERFSTAYFRFNDDTAAELQPGLRAPQDAQAFVARWDETARNLAQGRCDAVAGKLSARCFRTQKAKLSPTLPPARADPDDRICCMPGCREANSASSMFSLTQRPGEQIEAGQTRTAENGSVLLRRLDFIRSSDAVRSGDSREGHLPDTSSAAKQGPSRRPDPGCEVTSSMLHVKPPKEFDAEVNLELDVKRGGSRFLVFELSRFLQVQIR